MARLYHQSSHLGDEFLIENRVERVNLSYEAVDVRLSYEVTDWLRCTGGPATSSGGTRTTSSPGRPRWAWRSGAAGPSSPGSLRPLAAVDVQYREQNDWHTDLSARAGVQFEKLPIFDRRIQLLVEYFNGYSPNGQFYREKIEYLGLGIHFYLYCPGTGESAGQAVEREPAAAQELTESALHARGPLGQDAEAVQRPRRRRSRHDSWPSRTKPERMSAWHTARPAAAPRRAARGSPPGSGCRLRGHCHRSSTSVVRR